MVPREIQELPVKDESTAKANQLTQISGKKPEYYDNLEAEEWQYMYTRK